MNSQFGLILNNKQDRVVSQCDVGLNHHGIRGIVISQDDNAMKPIAEF